MGAAMARTVMPVWRVVATRPVALHGCGFPARNIRARVVFGYSLLMRRTFSLLCKGCGRRIVEAERIGEGEEATAAAHVAACFGLPSIPPRLEVLLTYVDVRVD